MTQKHFIKILILVVAVFGLWKIGSWQLITEEDRKWQADKVAYAEYSVYVNEIRKDFALQIFNEMGLVCSWHSGMMRGKLEEMELEFNAHRRATVEEARALQLLVMEKLVQAINAHEKLQPFLDERPMTYKRVSVSITFESANGWYCKGGVGRISNATDLAGAVENRNKLFYYSTDPFTGKLMDLFNEPYEEAVKLVQASPLQNPAVHQTTPLEEAVDEILPTFAKIMRDECGFECWSIGGKMTHSVEDIGVKFVVLRHATQDEARMLAIYATEMLLEGLNRSKRLRPFLSEYPFPVDRIKMRICFRKNNYYSYDDGSMESVTVEGNEITYFQEPTEELETDPLDTPVFAKESYQEACVLWGYTPDRINVSKK